MTGDCHVQFSESARVRCPRATRLYPYIGRRLLFDYLDESIPHSGVTIIAVLDHRHVCLFECRPILGHDCLVHRCKCIAVKAAPERIFIGFRQFCRVHGAIHVF